jgi:hypothetical protein
VKTPNQSSGNPAKAQGVPLAFFSEAAILFFFALLHPQREISNGLIAEVYDPIVGFLRAELVRRWARRGAEIVVEFPERLPAICIEANLLIFRSMTAELRQMETQVQPVGSLIAATAEQFCGARKLAEAILSALVEGFVEVRHA